MVNGLQVTHGSQLYAVRVVKYLVNCFTQTGAFSSFLQHVLGFTKVTHRHYIFLPRSVGLSLFFSTSCAS
jgi:hypothetical protein